MPQRLFYEYGYNSEGCATTCKRRRVFDYPERGVVWKESLPLTIATGAKGHFFHIINGLFGNNRTRNVAWPGCRRE